MSGDAGSGTGRDTPTGQEEVSLGGGEWKERTEQELLFILLPSSSSSDVLFPSYVP